MRKRVIILIAIAVLLITQSVAYFHTFSGLTRAKDGVELKAEGMLLVTDALTKGWFEAGDRGAYVDSLRRALPLVDLRFEGLSLFFYENDSIKYWGGNLYRKDILASTSERATTVECFDGVEVLTFYERRDSLTSIAVLLLSSPTMGRSEQFLIGDNGIVSSSALSQGAQGAQDTQGALGAIEVNIRGKGFYFGYDSGFEMPFVINILGWIGVVLLFYAVRLTVGARLTKYNAWQSLLLLALFFGVLRVLLCYIEVPQGVAGSWVSGGSLLLTLVVFLIIAEISYSARHLLRVQVSVMGRFARFAVFFVATLFSCILVAYFQFSLVSLTYVNAVDSEVHNIFSFDVGTLLFYAVCAVFAAARIMSTCFWILSFSKYPFWVRALLSISLSSVIALFIDSYIGHTGFLLVFFHSALLMLSYYTRSFKMGKIFVLKLFLLATYVTYFVVVAYSVVRDNEALSCRDRLVDSVVCGDSSSDISSKSIWYAIIKDGRLYTSKSSLFEPSAFTEMVEFGDGGVFEVGLRKYIVTRRDVDGAIVIVSTAKTSLLQIISFWSYIFLFMLILSGVILTFSGVRVYRHYSRRSMLYRVRTVIFVAIVGSMVVVCFVVYSYMRELSIETQRRSHRGSMVQLRDSFYGHMTRWQDNYNRGEERGDVMLSWLLSVRRSSDVDITLFDTTGHNIMPGASVSALYRISDRALCRLQYDSLSYHEYVYSVNEMVYTTSYIPLYDYSVGGSLRVFKYGNVVGSGLGFVDFGRPRPVIGYLSIISSQRVELVYRYDKLNDIFNIFVILFLVTIFSVMFFYWLISRPLGVLYSGLSGVGRMAKIRINSSIRLDNEVGAIIVQYNQLIDYLALSYQAIAKSEREGAWREMARQVSHEIKNPLTPMRLKIQILMRYRNGNCEEYRGYVDSTLRVLLEQIDVLARIASEFSDMSRVSRANITAIDLVGLLGSCVSLYSVRDGLRISFINDASPKVLVRAEYAAMNRVIINLLQNAIEASDSRECVIGIFLRLDGSNAVIEVRDNGRGISVAAAGKMFEPNFSTKSRGSGLGLAICRGVIESFGGTIEGYNIDCGGAMFVITLSLK